MCRIVGYARKTPLRMLPALADYARVRAGQLALPLSTYFGILLWNFSFHPRRMKPEPAAATLSVSTDASKRKLREEVALASAEL